MDYRFVREENWKYILPVLKIANVYGFINESYFKYDTFKQCKRYFYKSNDYESFCREVVFDIVNPIKRGFNSSYPVSNESAWCKPKSNLKLNDPNILILGKISSNYNGCPILERMVSSYRDVALDIIQYTFNILRKQLNTDEYRKKICTVIIDGISYKEAICNGRDMKAITEKKYKFLPYLNNLLNKNYPTEFPIRLIDGKKRFTSIFDSEKINESRVLWRKECEERNNEERQEWRYQMEEWEQEQNRLEEKQMIEDFWNEIGENNSNLD